MKREDEMRRLTIACWLSVCVVALCAGAAQADPGDLDTTYGQGGFAFSGFGNVGLDFSEAKSVAIQSDGKVVVAGSARVNGGDFSRTAIVLSRFNVDGTLDSTFGTNGRVTITFDAFNAAAAVRIQSDGKIVVAAVAAASTSSSAVRSLVLARFTSTGAPDFGFGTAAGNVAVNIGVGGGVGDMVIQGDGKILVAGTVVRTGTGADFLLVRFNTGGSLDTSFGQTTQFPNLTGSVSTDFGAQEQANAIALQSDGKIVVAGVTQFGVDSAFAVDRYNANGVIDNTFGGIGRVVTNFVGSDHGGSSGDAAFGVAVQGDGKIVVVGRAETDTGLARTDIAVARYNTNGTLDATFGTGGKVTTAIVAGDPQRANDAAFAVVIQPDGKIVTAGFTGVPFSEVFAVVRYTTSGALDTTFGSGGKVTTDRRGFIGFALAVQRVSVPLSLFAQGQIVVAGRGAPTGASTRMTTARFNGFTITFTRVGTVDLAPGDVSVAVHQPVTYTFTWTVPEPQTWHDLRFLELRIRDGNDTILSVLFDEAAQTFSLLNQATGRPGPSATAGSPQKLQTRDAVLDLAGTSVLASGPTSPTVTLNLALSFKPRTAGAELVVEVAATDDQGNDSGFVQAGTLSITPAR
jgi:uncharacterized delta-60 repeat protein